MKIQNVTDASFRKYGKVLEGYDFSALLKEMKHTPVPDDVVLSLIHISTREERKQIVEESFGNISASCDGCMAGLTEMYQEYIDGTKEIRDINIDVYKRQI